MLIFHKIVSIQSTAAFKFFPGKYSLEFVVDTSNVNKKLYKKNDKMLEMPNLENDLLANHLECQIWHWWPIWPRVFSFFHQKSEEDLNRFTYPCINPELNLMKGCSRLIRAFIVEHVRKAKEKFPIDFPFLSSAACQTPQLLKQVMH